MFEVSSDAARKKKPLFSFFSSPLVRGRLVVCVSANYSTLNPPLKLFTGTAGGTPASSNKFTPVTVESDNVRYVAFNASGQDARGPSEELELLSVATSLSARIDNFTTLNIFLHALDTA
jgi:hypothetical protein